MSDARLEKDAGHPVGPEGADASSDRIAEGRLQVWRRSSEFSATRKIGTLLGVCVIALVALIVWPAFNQRYAALQAYDHARGIAADAFAKFAESRASEEEARAEVQVAQATLANEARGSKGTTDLIERLTVQLDRARAEAQNAAEQMRTRDTRREATWQQEVAAGRAVDEATNDLLLRSGFAVALIFAAALLFWYVRNEKRRTFENQQVLKDIRERDLPVDDSLTLRALWRDNRDQLQLYHKLVLNYASSTRQTTLATLLVGFSFLVAAGAFSLFADNVASAVAVSVVSAAGAAVAGFIAQAVLKNSETSSREVLAFFSHPLEVERILAAERVIESMPESARDAARLLIVQALTRTSETALEAPGRSTAEAAAEAAGGTGEVG
ncbi:hypothetical protein [Nonomuraea sp. NPDC048826]|uniref:hypothetical protein n=1 Tax=Nonomuraea sp. NPDC048826 TaxID=3364347 RepID=UPI00372296DD